MKWQLQQLPLIRHLIYPSDCAKCFISTLSVSVHTNLWREYKDSSDQQEEMPPSTHTYSHTNAHTLIHTCTHSHTLTHSYTPSHKCTHTHAHIHTHTHTLPHTPAHTPCKVRHRDSCPAQGTGWISGAQPCSVCLSLLNSVLLSSFLKVFNISCTPICRNVYKHQTQLALELNSISEKPPLHPEWDSCLKLLQNAEKLAASLLSPLQVHALNHIST